MAVCSSSSPSCKSLPALHSLRTIDKSLFPSTFINLPPSFPWMTRHFSVINTSASPPFPTVEENPTTKSISILQQNQNRMAGHQDFIIDTLNIRRTEELAIGIHEKAREDVGIPPRKPAIEPLLKYLVGLKQWESKSPISEDLRVRLVHEVVSDFVRDGKFRVVDELLEAFNGDAEIAASALEAAIKGYNKLHMYRSSVAAYERMKSSGFMLDPGGYCLIMEAYMKVNKSKNVLKLFYEFQSVDKLASALNRTRVYEILIEALGRSGETLKALKYFREMRLKGTLANASIYVSLIGAFASSGEVKVAEKLFEEGRKNSRLKDPALFLKLVLMYVKVGLMEKTLDIVEMMCGANMKVSDCIFCAIVNGFAKQRGLRSAVEVHEDLISKGIKPGQVTLASVLNIYIRLGMYVEAEEVFGEMEARGFDKCVVAYSSMIVMYGKRGKLREATKLVTKMKAKGCEPNVWIYNSLIDLHGREKNLSEVEMLWKEMKRVKMGADKITYTSLISAYGRAKEYEKCLEVYKEFRMNGGVVDRAMAGIMVGVLSKNGRIDELVKILLEMKAQGTDMDDRLCRSAVNALRDAGFQMPMCWLEESVKRSVCSNKDVWIRKKDAVLVEKGRG